MGCGSDVTVTGQGIEIGHGKFYPSQYTKLLYRKLLTLKEKNEDSKKNAYWT